MDCTIFRNKVRQHLYESVGLSETDKLYLKYNMANVMSESFNWDDDKLIEEAKIVIKNVRNYYRGDVSILEESIWSGLKDIGKKAVGGAKELASAGMGAMTSLVWKTLTAMFPKLKNVKFDEVIALWKTLKGSMNLTEADMLADAGMGLGALAPPSKKKIARKGPAKLTGQQKLMAKGKTPEEQMSEPLYPAASKTKPDKKEYAGSDLSKVAGQEVSGLDEPKAGDWAKGGSTTGSEWAKAQLELAKMLAAKGIPKEQTTQVAQQVAEKAKDITDKKFLGLSKKGWVGAGIGLLVAAAIAVGYYALTKAGDKAGADELLAKGASKTTSAQQATGDIATSVGTKTATTATKGADVAQQATSDVATSTGAKAASTAAKVVDATTPLTTDYASKVSKNLAKIGEILKTDQEKGKMYLDKLGTAMAAANSEGKLTDNAALEALSKVMPSEKAEGWWNTAKLGFEMRNKL